MELQQTFTVPVPVDRAWDALLDPQRIAPCMPGASLESVEGDAFTGSVKIKLGPINLSYRGRARYVIKNADTRTIVIEGTGKDAKGGGGASATVTAVLTGDGDSTTVATITDLDVTGRPAQFGRGVMNDVANKLVGQFAANLAALLTSGDQEAATPATLPRQRPRRHPGPRAEQPDRPRRRCRRPPTGWTSSTCSACPRSPAAAWPPPSSWPTCSCWAGPSAGSATAASPPAQGPLIGQACRRGPSRGREVGHGM